MNSTHRPVISATGLYTPPDSISNAELVAGFDAFVAKPFDPLELIAVVSRLAVEGRPREDAP